MKGFIIDSNYSLQDQNVVIELYGRTSEGKSFRADVVYQPYFYIQKQDQAKAQESTPFTFQESTKHTMDGKEVVTLSVSDPKEIPHIRRILEDQNIPCYEADIRLTQRFFLDSEILSVAEIEGESRDLQGVDIYIPNAKVTPCTYTSEIQPVVFSFDIETDMKGEEIYSISIYMEHINEVHVVPAKEWKTTKTHIEDITINTYATEKELIQGFVQRIQELDPDIITGWNMIDFDLQVIQKRAKKYEIPLLIGRTKGELQLRIESSFLRDSHAQVTGRCILDGIQLLKSSFIKLDDYKLNTAAKHFLKDTKLIEDDNRFEKIDELYHFNQELFLAYNAKDSKLVYDILYVSGVLDLTIQRSLLTGLHLDNVKASIASFDSLYIREMNKAGIVAPTTRPQNRDNEGLGGYVRDSKPGIYNNILVLDFKSLYPSLMRTFNIDPIAFVGEKNAIEDVENTAKYIIAPNDAVFKNNQGILSNILATLWNAREQARKDKNELARYAIKILMNSMYGVLASPNSRFHRRIISNAITHFAHHFSKMIAQEVEKKGYDVIYGDTDSIFVNPNEENTCKAVSIGKDIESTLNNFLKKHISKTYARESILELEFEKTYVKFFMPKVRGSEIGAKKRYAGLKLIGQESISEHSKIETTVDITGLEFVRRDWTEVAKVFQMHLLELVFDEQDIEQYIKKFVSEIKEGKHDELLIYTKALRKDMDEYTKTTPPHVKAARLLDKVTSNIIRYVMTLDGPQPVEKISHPFDYEHYIDKQIKPIAESFLELKGKQFDDLLKGNTQKGLHDFF